MNDLLPDVPGSYALVGFCVYCEYHSEISPAEKFLISFGLCGFRQEFCRHNISLNGENFLNDFNLVIFLNHGKLDNLARLDFTAPK
jgi:hypothetical protein